MLMAAQGTKTLTFIASKNEAGNVRTFIFETGGLHWLAGQYQAYQLPQAGAREEENQRWFTVAAAPSEGEIHISTRITESAFKKALNALVPGDTIRAHGLEGDFTWEEEPSDTVILVAGGIGVTPFRSILLERQATGKKLNASLIYFNRTDDIPFRDEFDALAKSHSEFVFRLIVGEPVTAETILRHAGDASGKVVYLSGPEPMVESVGNDLKARGVVLKQDWFPGYDEKNY